jgi:hypothetical protein
MGKVTLNAENHNTPGDPRWMLNISSALALRFQNARPRQSFAPN